jgi:tetratricopeptide (TPR) repeat protein
VARSGGFVELDHWDVAQSFVRDLSQLRQRAGRPSYSTLERLSGHKLRRATVSDVLNGNRVRVPEWRFVAAFVAACRAAAEESGLDPATLGTMADWKRHWDGASHGVLDVRFPGSGHPPPGGRDQPELTPAGGLEPAAEARYAAAAPEPVQPQARSAMWGPVPPRLPDFIGREAWLAGVGDALANNGQSSAVVIQGLCGIGKSQLAVEYAYHAASEYNLVWWVPCDDMDSAHAAMATMETALGLDGEQRAPGEDRYARLFDLLQQGERSRSWLLIFDNANEPDLVRSLLPPINGHVLITSRNSRWEATGEMIELDEFTRAESIEFLRRRMRRFDATAAHQLADAVGDLPVLLEHAVESQVTTGQYIERLQRDPLGLLRGQPSDYQGTIAGEWRMVLDRLRNQGPDFLELLARLCFFGNEPIPRDSLERGSYLQGISIHGLLRDPIRRNRAIMMLRRAGVLRVRADTRVLEVHQATRHVVRAMVAQAGPDSVERSRHDVHLLLAAADPLDPEDPANWRSYDELRGHAAQSAAQACADESVRRLVINMARSLTATGDPRACLALADDALGHWTAGEASGSDGISVACLAMRHAKAVALLACGEHEEAFHLQEQTLAAMRSESGHREPDVIILDRMNGARHRIAGNFRAAGEADEESARVHVREFGPDDPRAFPAITNLVLDLALTGEYARATREALRVYGECMAFYNDPAYPAVLFHRNVLGRCHWLSGRHEAAGILAEVHAGYGVAVDRGVIDENHPWCLANELDYAIARRDKGLSATDLVTLADDLYRLRRRCWRGLGEDDLQTLAATVALASILRRVGGRAYEALRMLDGAERRYQSVLPDHPYALACRGYGAAVRCQVGADGGLAGSNAAVDLADAVASLSASVGDGHPLTLAAASSLANALADGGKADAALAPGERALEGFRDLLGSDHPYVLACAANLTIIRARLGDDADKTGSLIYVDFTPLPL